MLAMSIECLSDLRAGAVKCAVTALLGLAVAAVPVHADPRTELAQARHDLTVSEQVLARISERVEVARADPATGDEQRLRLDAYLAHVRDLVAANRERARSLAQAVDALPAGTPAPASGAGAAATAKTDAEEVAALDAKLGESLSAFDQLLLEDVRRARTRERGGAAGGRAPGAGGGAAGAEGAEPKADGESGAPGSPGAGNESEPPGSTSGQGSPGGRVVGARPGTPGGTAVTPPDVGNGNDDDIVARQIRKAAESEPDPELRKKLWDEYRKYKQGASG
jgi:hypothetical protein